jgi:hypothetical protein
VKYLSVFLIKYVRLLSPGGHADKKGACQDHHLEPTTRVSVQRDRQAELF